MNILIWGTIYLIIASAIFGAGYLFAAREFGKDVKFYKDCVRMLRVQILGHVQEIETLKRIGK